MNNTHKRQFRELSDSTKAKISQSLRGRSKTPTHSENISKALKTYWKGVPSKNKDVEKLMAETFYSHVYLSLIF